MQRQIAFAQVADVLQTGPRIEKQIHSGARQRTRFRRRGDIEFGAQPCNRCARGGAEKRSDHRNARLPLHKGAQQVLIAPLTLKQLAATLQRAGIHKDTHCTRGQQIAHKRRRTGITEHTPDCAR